MNVYFFSFANIVFRIVTPFHLEIGEESTPFLLSECSQFDLEIYLSPIDSIPSIPDKGVWVEDSYYGQINDIPVVYFRNLSGEAPYVFLTFEDSVIRCRYLPEFESRIRDSSSLLNLIGLERILLDRNGFLLHSSLIRFQDRAILFSAPCGVGKSTQAALWNTFENAEILNGDRAGVRFEHEWTAYGMPFAGTSGIYQNESATITTIVTLEQWPENVIRRLRPMEAVRKLLSEVSCRRWDGAFMSQMLDFLVQLSTQIPVYHLQCTPDEGAVNLLLETLKKDGLV